MPITTYTGTATVAAVLTRAAELSWTGVASLNAAIAAADLNYCRADTNVATLTPVVRYSEYLSLTGFNLAVAAGKVPIAYRFDVVGAQLSSLDDVGYGIQDDSIKLVLAGVPIGSEHARVATLWPTDPAAPGTIVWGGSTDGWNVTLSAANVNSAGFGLLIAISTHMSDIAIPPHQVNQAGVDFATVTVYAQDAATVSALSASRTRDIPETGIRRIDLSPKR